MNHFSYRPAPDKLLWSASWLGQLRWGVVLLLITLSVRVNAQTAPASITVTGGCLGGTYVLNKFADPYENTNRPAYRGVGAFTLTPQSGPPTTYSNENVDVYYVPSASKWVLSTGGLIALSNASTSAQPPTTGWVTETNAQFGNCNQTTPFNAATGTASVTPTVVAAVCVGSPVSLTATSMNLTSPVSYTWSSSPAGFSGSGNVFTQNAPSVGSQTTFTVSVTAIASGGAQRAIASASVTVRPTPGLAIGAGSNPTSCGGTNGSIAFTTTNLPNGDYTLNYTGPSGASSKTVTVVGNAFSLTGLSAGGYSNFSITNNGCTGSVATARTLSDPPTPILTVGAATNPSTCGATNGSIAFTSVNLPNGPYSLTYTGAGSPKTITVSGNAFSLTGLSAGTYSNFSITNNGCTGSAATARTLSDPAQPIASVGANQSLCTGTTATLSATATNGTGVWSVVNGPSTASTQFNNTASASATFTPAGGAGTYTLRWTVTSGNCTPATADVIITINSLPTLTLGASGNPATCGGSTGSIGFSTNLPDGPYSLSYTGTGTPKIVTVSSGAFSLTGLTAGNYSNFSISNGCVGTLATPVTLNDPVAPTLTVGSPTNPTSCSGTNGSIAFTTTNLPDGPYSLTYTGTGSPKTVTVSGGAFSLTELTAGNYSNFSISNNGCTGSAATSRTLSDPAAPTLTLGASVNPTTCGGAEGSIAFTTTNLPDGPYSLTYTGTGSPAAVTVSGGAFSLTGLSAGTYSNFSISNNGCTGSVATSRTLSGPLQPVLTVGSETNPTSCGASNGSIAFTVTNLPDGLYSLTVLSGLASPKTVTVIGGAFSLTGLAAGSYTNFAISNNGCVGSAATTRLLTDPNLVLTVGSSTNPTTCGASNGSIAFTVTNLPDGLYSLTVLSGLASPKTVTVIGGAFSLTGLAAGSYTNFAISNNGCVGSAATTRLLTDPGPVLTVGSETNPTSCGASNGSIAFTVTNLPDGPYSLTYSGAGSPKAVTVSSGAFSLTGLPAGGYSFFTIGSNGCVGAAATARLLSDPAAPTLTVGTTTNPTTCGGNNGSIAFTTSLPNGSYTVSYSGVGSPQIVTVNGGSFTLTGLTAGTYNSFSVTSNGCVGIAATPVTLNDPAAPVAGLLNNGPFSCTTVSITLTASGGVSYTFSSGATQLGGNTSPTATVASPGTYSVLVTGANGCTASASTTVTGSNDVPPAPNLMSRTVVQNSGDITLTATNCSGTLNWTGPNGTAGTGSIIVPTGNAGSFVYSATCVVGLCSSPPTSVTVTVTPAGNQPLQLVTPLYNCRTGSLTFQTVGGNGSLIEFMAIGVTGWSSNPTHIVEAELRADANSSGVLNLMARQNGNVVSLNFDFRAFCAGSNGNQPPQVMMPISTQNATQGSPFSFAIPAGTFSDPENQTLTLTLQGLPNGLSFVGGNTISGTPTQSGNFPLLLTATDPGGLSANTTFQLVIAPSGAVQPLTLIEPLYNCQTGAITFRTSGGNGSLIEYMAIGVTGWSPNPSQTVDAALRQDLNSSSVLTLMARQNGVIVSLAFDFRAFCQGVPVNNLPPVFHGPIASQLGTQGQPFSYQIPQAAFSDPENGALTFSATGLPPGLTFTGGTRTISGTPTQPGSYTVTITAADPQNASTSGSLVITIQSSGTGPSPLQLVTPLYNCQTGQITFQTTGGNGSTIEFMAVGVTGWTTNPQQTVDAPLRQDLNSSSVLNLMARQNGVVVSLAFDFRAFCNQGARPVAQANAERQPLQVTVLGNPVLNEVLEVAIRGAQGESLRLALTDMNGHTVAERQVDSAAAVERQTIRVGRSVGSILLLRVSTATQQQVVKVLVP